MQKQPSASDDINSKTATKTSAPKFDFELQTIFGYVVLTVTPLVADLSEIRLNSGVTSILRVSVEHVDAKFIYDNPLNPVIPPTSRKGVQHFNDYRQQYTYALQEADEGELVITLPKGVAPVQQINDTPVTVPEVDTFVENSTNGEQRPPVKSAIPTYRPLSVRVDFELVNPSAGVQFVLPDPDVDPDRYPHAYTYNQASSARCWIPCLDRWQERCTWELQVITPGKLRDALPSVFGGESVHMDSDSVVNDEWEDDGNRDIIVVCGGELMEQVVHPDNPAKKITTYTISTVASAPDVLLAIGPFENIEVASWARRSGHVSDSDDEAEDIPMTANHASTHDHAHDKGTAYAFCLPGRTEELEYTTSILAQMISFCERYLGVPLPFPTYNQVFVEDTYNAVTTGAGMALLSTNLLLDEDIIDQTFETMRLLIGALTAQWFGHFVVPKTWADTWLTVGLCNYLSGLFLERFFGRNEYKFRLKKDMQRVCELDVNQPPLYPTITTDDLDLFAEQSSMVDPLLLHHFHPSDDWASVRAEFISLKAGIILYMLETRVGKGSMRKVLNKILVTTKADELPNGLSTHQFIRTTRKLTGKLDLKTFTDQWIYGSGCPRFTFQYSFNKKKMVIEFKYRQDNTNGGILGSTSKFTGPFTIRVHEPTQTYDTEVLLEDLQKQYDIQYHTKYRRIRRKTVKGKKGAEDQTVPEEEDAKGEWNDEEPDRSTFDWVRLDPDNEWLCVMVFEQPDFMWATQLKRDKEVYAQYEALSALAKLPSQGTVMALAEFLEDKTVYYGLRVEAALALAKCASEQKHGVTTRYLLTPYREKYCYQDATEDILLPRSNNFNDLPEYYVQKAMITALASVRESPDVAPLLYREFLLNLLKFNDNTGNRYSDSYFVANLITALCNSFLPAVTQVPKKVVTAVPRTGDTSDVEEFDLSMFGEGTTTSTGAKVPNIPLLQDAVEEVERYRTLDRLIPSYHNSVTVACLEAQLKWMMVGMVPVNLVLFIQHARYGNFIHVRLIAIDALLMLDTLMSPTVAQFILNLVAEDPVPYVRYHVAKAIAELVFVMDEESRAAGSSGSESALSAWDALRYHLSNRQDIARDIWRMMNSGTTVEHRVRINLLRFCEYLYEPAPEGSYASSPAPKIKLKIPLNKRGDDSASEDEGTPTARKGTSKGTEGPRTMKISIKPRIPKPPSTPALDLPKPDARFLEVSKKTLLSLRNHPAAAPFTWPVDSSNTHYYQVIKRPMDLHTVDSNVKAGVYRDNMNTFFSDIRQIFKNCFEYNLEDSAVYQKAKQLEKYFDTKVIPQTMSAWNEPPEPVVVENEVANQPVPTPEPSPARLPVDLPVVPASALPPPPPQQSTVVPEAPPITEELSTSPAQTAHDHQVTTPAEHVAVNKEVKKEVGLSQDEAKKCKRVWKSLFSHHLSHWFRTPVDPVALNLPTYFEVVKEPMDLSTIKQKLDQGIYSSPFEFESDVRLMFSNSLKFNPPGTQVNLDTRTLIAEFDKEWKSRGSRAGSPAPGLATPKPKAGALKSTPEGKLCENILVKLQSHIDGFPFLHPVDPVALNIPQYPTIVKRPMDLSTIRKKFDNGVYKDSEDFRSDVDLMLHNCFLFNMPGDAVHEAGKRLESFFKKEWNAAGFKGAASRDGTPASARASPAAKRAGSLKASPTPTTARGATPVARTGATASNGAPRHKTPSAPTPSYEIAESHLSVADEAKIRTILIRVRDMDEAFIFREPVDPAVLPDYYRRIKKPMDLQTMRKKLDKEKYKTPDEFAKDMKQMFANCFDYNPQTSYGHNCGLAIQKVFQAEWRQQFGKDAGSGTATPVETSKKRKSDYAESPSEKKTKPNPIKLRASATPVPGEKTKKKEKKGGEVTESPAPKPLKLTLKLKK
ncbi:hypothetical protein HDU85_005168 [Gaertneriomyces sp. JEL0708]|nr:hypothetical protein HDU85_005168 [Gaertneriomyces sp. JEL0708]